MKGSGEGYTVEGFPTVTGSSEGLIMEGSTIVEGSGEGLNLIVEGSPTLQSSGGDRLQMDPQPWRIYSEGLTVRLRDSRL